MTGLERLTRRDNLSPGAALLIIGIDSFKQRPVGD